MLMRRAAAFAKSGSEREVEEGYPEVGRSVRSSREESSVWGHVRPHCTSAKCHYRRKTWAFPRPRAHMHAHEASEQADTLTCYTAGEFARSTTRARPHHLTRRGPKGRAKSRGPEGTQGAPRKMRRQCAATPRACCPQPSLAAAAASLALSKTPAVLTSTRPASETAAAPGGCGGLTNPGAAETPRARAPSSSSRLWRLRAPNKFVRELVLEPQSATKKTKDLHDTDTLFQQRHRPCRSREQVRAKAEGPGVFKRAAHTTGVPHLASDPREHTPRSSTQELRRQGSSRQPRVPPRQTLAVRPGANTSAVLRG